MPSQYGMWIEMTEYILSKIDGESSLLYIYLKLVRSIERRRC
jgi:hypothetical protein